MMMMNKTKKGLCGVITATWLSLFAMAPVATTAAAAAVTSLRGPNESSDVSTVVDGENEEASQQQPRRDLMNYAHNTHGNYIQHTGNTYYYPPLAHEPLRRPMHGGGGGAGNKKQCRPQNVSGRYANCYSCYTSIGSRGGKIVPGCYQTPGEVQLVDGRTETLSIDWIIDVTADGIVSGKEVIETNLEDRSKIFKDDEEIAGLLDLETCALTLLETNGDNGMITGHLSTNGQGGATIDVVETVPYTDTGDGGVLSFHCEKVNPKMTAHAPQDGSKVCSIDRFPFTSKYQNCQDVEHEVYIDCATRRTCTYTEYYFNDNSEEWCVVRGSFNPIAQIGTDPARPDVCQLEFISLNDSCVVDDLGFGMKAEVDMSTGHANNDAACTSSLMLLQFSTDGGSGYYNADKPRKAIALDCLFPTPPKRNLQDNTCW